MATINGFHPHIYSQKNKSQIIHLTSHDHQQKRPMLAYQQPSSFTKILTQFISSTKYRLLTKATHASDHSSQPAEAQSSDESSWKNWILGLMLSIVMPSLRRKYWGPLLSLKSKVDMAIETVESVTEVVEELAEEVEKVAEEVADKLPDDSKLKDAVESIEHLAEEAVKKAELAEDIIHKVEEVEKEIEKALMTGSDIDSVNGDAQKKP